MSNRLIRSAIFLISAISAPTRRAFARCRYHRWQAENNCMQTWRDGRPDEIPATRVLLPPL